MCCVAANQCSNTRYLLALCCFRLEKLEEAEAALLSSGSDSVMAPEAGQPVANGAAGLFLMGQVKERQQNCDQAVKYYSQCLDLCPFMWCAYERLSCLVLATQKSSCPTHNFASMYFDESRFGAEHFTRKRCRPDAEVDSVDVDEDYSSTASKLMPAQDTMEKRLLGGLRMGSSGFVASPDCHKENGHEVQLTFVGMLYVFGTALHALHGFLCQQALEVLRRLPSRHYQTSYVQDIVARCRFESAEYTEAVEVYSQCKDMASCKRSQGLEYYSTALWHLRNDLDLGCLAKKAVEAGKFKPETWCVVGNFLSRQREHDRAITCFRRSIQLDPYFTYAYTLCGHEYSANEKFDQAIAMYERAVNLDSRHYNAWWGLGQVYLCQEEHQNARYHFQKALEINTSNAVLHISMGLVAQALQEPQQALIHFTEAAQLNRQCSAHALYQKGCVLASLGQYSQAIEELKQGQELAPREPCIHFRLGKAYVEIGDTHKALRHFTLAMDLGSMNAKDQQILVAAQAELSRSLGVHASVPRSAIVSRRHAMSPVDGSNQGDEGDDSFSITP